MSRKERSRSWDSVATWYAGWSGARGGHHHVEAAIPLVLELLRPQPGDRVLDLGCGTGALCRPVLETGGSYTGVDLSPRMIAWARRNQPSAARFLVGDVTRWDGLSIRPSAFEAAAFLLSIQDIAPLEGALRTAGRALESGGRLGIVMTHPCFRVPRQSGWVWDRKRRLASRRVDRYLTPTRVPMGTPGRGRGGSGQTWSWHRPVGSYVAALSAAGFVLDSLVEVPAPPGAPGRDPRNENSEIPMFLGLRARREEGARREKGGRRGKGGRREKGARREEGTRREEA